jgi:peptide deformylase
MSEKNVKGICIYGDAILRKRAEAVEGIDDKIFSLIERMKVIIALAKGVGLAAPQVGEGIRLFIVEERFLTGVQAIRVFINPELLEKEGRVVEEEGCLSLPDIDGNVERAKRVKVSALNEEGKPFTIEANDLYARAIQHEMDHLNGVLIVDHFGHLKRSLISKRLKRLAQGARDEGK